MSKWSRSHSFLRHFTADASGNDAASHRVSSAAAIICVICEIGGLRGSARCDALVGFERSLDQAIDAKMLGDAAAARLAVFVPQL